jgi:hypothetical protein
MASSVERALARAVVDGSPTPSVSDLEAVVGGEVPATERVDVVFDPVPGMRL